VPLADIPEPVQKAFIAAEDKRFYQHKGVDERGLVRAFIANVVHPDRPQGGSTITQQVAKNVLVGSAVTYERKIREVVVAARLERMLSKRDILELYLNSIYLGRGSWGVEMAARSYFGKNARALTMAEGALLASLAKGPAYFNPDRYPERAQERYTYVLDRMKEDGYLSAEAVQQALRALPQRTAEERHRRDTGYHFIDQLAREARKDAHLESLTGDSYSIHATLDPGLQRASEAALQEGLARYEMRTGRVQFEGAETNLAEAVAALEKAPAAAEPSWRRALAAAQLPLYDVHWTGAVVLGERGKSGLQVGLADGRVLPLTAPAGVQRSLKPYDVVYVRVVQTGKKTAKAELRVRPQVQGAAVVLENKTGRILAMAGAFSYPLSQLNRTTQSQRQPGSAFKPFAYLAALHNGLQPNTLIQDEPITLPPVGGIGGIVREYNADPGRYDWTPKNFDGGALGIVTLRRALERSRNLATAHLLQGGIDYDPERSLAQVCALAVEARLYKDCVPHYPFILGAQPVRPIDLAAFYAAVANEGRYVAPHAIDLIEQNGRIVYHHAQEAPHWLANGDRAAFYQLKTMLQGVVGRGTASPMRRYAAFVGGKTGTSDDANDAWFVGFTNDVTIAVWVGYDNGDGKRRTLGGSQTGAKVALPIFESIIDSVWALAVAPKVALAPPSPEARRNLVAMPIDLASGTIIPGGGSGTFTEYFRRDPAGQYEDTQYKVVSRYEAQTAREESYENGRVEGQQYYPWEGPQRGGWYVDQGGRVYRQQRSWQEPAPRGGWYVDRSGRVYRQQLYPQQPPPRPRRNFLDELFGNDSPPPQTYREPRSGPSNWNLRPYN
jgi:membrane carboxypeptidase/penicillin-binding protein